MAIAFRSKDEQVATGGSTTSVNNRPSGVVADDILLLFVYIETTVALTYPSGFTEVAAINASNSSFALHVAWKRATGGEPATYTTSWTGGSYADTVMAAYSGCVTTGSPMDATPTVSALGSGSGSIVSPSITTVSANAMVISFVGDIAGNALTKPAAMTVRSTFDDQGFADVIQAAAGASGTFSWTLGGGATQRCAVTLALAPPGGSGTTYTDTGSATSVTTGTGADIAVLSDTGSATSAATGSGAAVAILTDDGSATSAATGSGADAAIFGDSASAVMAATGSGAESAVYSDAATAISATTGSGAEVAVLSDTGAAVMAATGSGDDANAYVDAGGATSTASASGADAAVFEDSATASSTAMGSGADAPIYSDTGAAVAALFGFGADVVVMVDAGGGVLTAVGSGSDGDIPLNLPYQGDAYRYDSGGGTGSIAGGTVQPAPSQASPTGSTSGGSVQPGPNQDSPTGAISGGIVLAPDTIYD